MLRNRSGHAIPRAPGRVHTPRYQTRAPAVLSDQTNRTSTIAALSLAVGVIVLALKLFAAQATGSVALLSDALESVVNVITALVALLAVRLAARPADAVLPYGYGKAEYFSAVVIGALITVAAILIFREAWSSYVAPHRFTADPLAIAVSVAASAVNAGWALVLGREGRRVQSPSLIADSKHLFTDVVSTVGVLLGVLLAAMTGWMQLDSLLAALVGLTILWSGWQLIRSSVIGLMDVAVDEKTLRQIRELIAAHAEGAIEAHDLRTRQAGQAMFIEFHLVVPGAMTVDQAHAICDSLEARLREAIGPAQITIHVEPENKAKHSGIVVV